MDYITMYIYGLTFILGLVMGSFCNAWAWRIAHNESISKGRSHCPSCNHILGILDLFPLFSYIGLKGRCRYCKIKISPRYPIAELLLGLGFVSSFCNYGYMDLPRAIMWMMALSLLLTISLVDMEIFEIPHRLLLGLIIVFFAFNLIIKDVGYMKEGIIACVVLALVLFALVLFADKIMARESMGAGDIKLLAVLGLYVGMGKTLLLVIVACVIGIAFGTFAQRKDRAFAFGPSIALGAWIVMFFGDEIIKWYMSLFV